MGLRGENNICIAQLCNIATSHMKKGETRGEYEMHFLLFLTTVTDKDLTFLVQNIGERKKVRRDCFNGEW